MIPGHPHLLQFEIWSSSPWRGIVIDSQVNFVTPLQAMNQYTSTVLMFSHKYQYEMFIVCQDDYDTIIFQVPISIAV